MGECNRHGHEILILLWSAAASWETSVTLPDPKVHSESQGRGCLGEGCG